MPTRQRGDAGPSAQTGRALPIVGASTPRAGGNVGVQPSGLRGLTRQIPADSIAEQLPAGVLPAIMLQKSWLGYKLRRLKPELQRLLLRHGVPSRRDRDRRPNHCHHRQQLRLERCQLAHRQLQRRRHRHDHRRHHRNWHPQRPELYRDRHRHNHRQLHDDRQQRDRGRNGQRNNRRKRHSVERRHIHGRQFFARRDE